MGGQDLIERSDCPKDHEIWTVELESDGQHALVHLRGWVEPIRRWLGRVGVWCGAAWSVGSAESSLSGLSPTNSAKVD